ncbi:hypothetical protein ACO0KY_15225 [Undibacterium sp. Dicai25W]|uniref:hypothetical protein n=1 Tax=Undibacterium sp. Dicai25W TaxID=3413034 RepID=UPI003BF2D2B8
MQVLINSNELQQVAGGQYFSGAAHDLAWSRAKTAAAVGGIVLGFVGFVANTAYNYYYNTGAARRR